MINLLPEPKHLIEKQGSTRPFYKICLNSEEKNLDLNELLEITELRLWNYKEIKTAVGEGSDDGEMPVHIILSLNGLNAEQPELFKEQGYDLDIREEEIILKYENRAGFINAVTS